VYYLLQAAYNVDALVTLLELSLAVQVRVPRAWAHQSPVAIYWRPTVRGDFREMAVHHVITNLLIVGSSVCRLTRIGSMVFLVHDVSDVPVDLSKLANFLKYKWTTLSCFLTMVLVWMAARLYILPFVIYRSILTQSHHVTQGVPVLLYMYYRHVFYTLVALLIGLHVTWFGMFLQIFATFLRKNECHDLSEHKQGETQQQQQQQKQRASPSKAVPSSRGTTNSSNRRVHCDEKKDD
jgi:TLC domain